MSQEVSLGTSQKVGFGTLNKNKHALGALKRPWPMFDERYWFVRHPVERFQSLYKYIQTQATLPRLVALRPLSPDYLLEHIEQHWGEDSHWRSQCDHLGKFEAHIADLSEMGKLIPSLERQNVTHSSDVALQRSTVERIVDLYRQDLELWQTRKPITTRALRPI